MEQERTEETEKVRNHLVLAPGRINLETPSWKRRLGNAVLMNFDGGTNHIVRHTVCGGKQRVYRKTFHAEETRKPTGFSVLSVPSCEIKPA